MDNAEALKGVELRLEGMNNEIGLHTSAGQMIRSWLEIENSLPVDEHGSPLQRDVALSYPIDVEGMYILIPELGPAPLKAVTLRYRITEITNISRIDFPLDGKYLMQDMQSGNRQFFADEQGVIRPKSSPRN